MCHSFAMLNARCLADIWQATPSMLTQPPTPAECGSCRHAPWLPSGPRFSRCFGTPLTRQGALSIVQLLPRQSLQAYSGFNDKPPSHKFS